MIRPSQLHRSDIQILRGVAVILVVVFHLWPAILPGGYVGVDVFFVISGYLITGSLMNEALERGRISLLGFYTRRIRRLLPAANVVLAVSALGSLLFLPAWRWEGIANQIIASGLYFENWVLAALAIDYLDSQNAASPVQHYWSLSIEEQFYILWPVLIVAISRIARRRTIPLKPAITGVLAMIFIGSLYTSAISTSAAPAQAYFFTQTRIWELALGGLLALLGGNILLSEVRATGLYIVGISALLFSALTFSAETAFPGIAALVPTLGTASMLVAAKYRAGKYRGSDTAVLRYLGDRSYSIYLWHWPVIVFWKAHQSAIGFWDGLIVGALTIAISHISFRHIEERFRQAGAPASFKPLGYSTASIAICLLAYGGMEYALRSQQVATASIYDPQHPGPATLLSAASVPEDTELVPPPAQMKRDLPSVYFQKCHQNQVDDNPIFCEFGNPESDHTIIVVGDSIAAQWVPALERIADDRNWRLLTFTKSACPIARASIALQGAPYANCRAWQENVIGEITSIRPQYVFTSQSIYSYVETDEMVEGLRSVWNEFVDAGAKVIAIQSTPVMPFEPGDCLTGNNQKCAALRSGLVSTNIFSKAALSMPGVEVVDMIDGICDTLRCNTVVGNVIVWRDNVHLTATYAAKLAPYLAERVGL